jgi:peptidase C13-like protein
VFSDEIKLAAQRISDRYDAAQRTVLLLNDRRDLDSHPLATVEGLKLALRDVAARMDVEKDVLFLALSSHGDDEPSLSVSNTSVSLRDLSGADLAEALRASGIKWKVIVISACHAGAFINALRDDNSAIFTAAAADRTSFGCSDDRELTYFGEAFYRDALPRSATLQEAFSGAEADIASREEREHVRASNPQSFIGSAIRSKLEEIDSTARCNTGCKQSVPESQSTRP